MEEVTRIEDGKAVIYRRGGVFYARIHIGPNQYKYKSLKTGNTSNAIAAGRRFCYQLEFKQEHGLPINDTKLSIVIDAYIKYRENEFKHKRTKLGMLRQIKRNLKFWREYVGDKPIASITGMHLDAFVDWRRSYYSGDRAAKMHHNAKLQCSDKEIVFNLMTITMLLKWAQSRGYLGKAALPKSSFKMKKVRVRPAFELNDYRKLWRQLIKWERACTNPEHLHTRQLLRDYVLILANSGMRVGEANNLKIRDVQKFSDGFGRTNCRFVVRGKTGERDVIPRASAVKYVDRLILRKNNPQPDDWLFAMKSGSKVITLADQFNKVMDAAGISENAGNEKHSLYSLRHFYAVMSLRTGIPVWDVSRNMGTSVEMIEKYYGRNATTLSLATTLGGKPLTKKKTTSKVHKEEQLTSGEAA